MKKKAMKSTLKSSPQHDFMEKNLKQEHTYLVSQQIVYYLVRQIKYWHC